MLLIASFFSLYFVPTDSIKVDAKMLDEVQITANRVISSQYDTPFSIESISRNQLANSSLRTIPEVLIGTTGVFVQKTNHGGGSPFVRGLTGNQALILVDGIRLNNSTFRYGPNQYLTTIDPFSLDKIEILKGSGSVQYGSDALGGVIHTITQNPQLNSKFTAHVLAKLTPNMEKTVRPSLSIGFKNIAFNLSTSWRNFDDLIAGQGIGKQTPTGYTETSNNFKTFVNLKNGSLIAAFQNYGAKNVPLYHKVVLENFKINEFGEQKRNLSYLKYNQKTQLKFVKDLVITTSLQDTYETRLSQKNNSTTKTIETDQVQVLGFTTAFTSQFTENYQAHTGIEFYSDLVKSKKQNINTVTAQALNIQRGLYPNNAKYNSLSAFSLHQLKLNKWRLTAGLRYNYFVISIPTETFGTSVLKPKAMVGNMAILRPLSPATNFYVSYNSGFRAPNIDDMGTLGLVDFRYEIPNYNLKPEVSQNYELGLKHQTKNFSLSTAIFYNQLKNLITRVKLVDEFREGNQVYLKQNSENAYIKGAEFNLISTFAHHFKGSAGITYLYGQNITKNEPIRRIPPLNGRFDVTFEKKSFFIKPEFLFANSQNRLAQGDIDDNRIGANGTAGWQVVNLYSGYHFSRIKTNFLLNNLTNKAYKMHGSGVYGIGRAVSLSLEISI